ncbi:efflux RND transporter periplasmic adaptor subunit [Alishewanella sp. HL-SH06]|uniref:efflux RND transporter periplasmic adaptor subunit n=1 Tax=Alishewanella sp. HL-SH06 TaxID=3461144 RepID=UPI00404253D1
MRHLLAISLLWSGVLWAKDVVPVQAIQPVANSLAEQLTVSGTLTARQDANLSSKTAGLVAQVHVDAGKRVAAGDVLLTLDAALAQHDLAQFQAGLALAEVNLQEQQRLVAEAETLTSQQLFPQTELALRKAALRQAEALKRQAAAALAQQQEQVARHQLTAPFAGVVVERYTDVGEYVNLGAPVFRLVALTPLYLDVQLPQEYYPALADLSHIDVISDLYPNNALSATLTADVPVTSGNARSFLARLTVESQLSGLLPGTSARAVFHFQQRERQVLVVPADALLRHADGKFSVFSIADGKAYRRLVTLGRNTTAGVEIVSGLPKGEAVVVRGNENLRDGQAVRLVSVAGGN